MAQPVNAREIDLVRDGCVGAVVHAIRFDESPDANSVRHACAFHNGRVRKQRRIPPGWRSPSGGFIHLRANSLSTCSSSTKRVLSTCSMSSDWQSSQPKLPTAMIEYFAVAAWADSTRTAQYRHPVETTALRCRATEADLHVLKKMHSVLDMPWPIAVWLNEVQCPRHDR